MTTHLYEAIAQAAESARQLGILATGAQGRVVELERELEEARQEIGRFRTGAEEDDPLLYLLWSGKHQAWWKPDARGYTTDTWEAGRYTRSEAVQHVVASAQCGVREQVTSMVAAPETWDNGRSTLPVVLAVDPGVQVEQEVACPAHGKHPHLVGSVCLDCSVCRPQERETTVDRHDFAEVDGG